jgi:hypothetical protein
MRGAALASRPALSRSKARAADARAVSPPQPLKQKGAPAPGDLIFWLTAAQASALLSIKLAGRVRAESQAERRRLLEGLQRKGLVLELQDDSGEIALTDLGRDAATLCARMALNGHPYGRPQASGPEKGGP